MRSWDASPITIRSRLTVIRFCLDSWGLEGFTPDNVVTYLASSDLRSKWSRSTYYNHLNSFGSWATDHGYLPVNPMDKDRRPRPPKSTPRPLSNEEVQILLNGVRGETRDWTVIALNSGLRAGEVAALRGQDVTARGTRVRGKGDVTVTLPCHPDVWAIAQRYPRVGYWFPGT